MHTPATRYAPSTRPYRGLEELEYPFSRLEGSPLWYWVGPWPAILGWTLVLVDQIQPVQLGRELAATEEHAGRPRPLRDFSPY